MFQHNDTVLCSNCMRHQEKRCDHRVQNICLNYIRHDAQVVHVSDFKELNNNIRVNNKDD